MGYLIIFRFRTFEINPSFVYGTLQVLTPWKLPGLGITGSMKKGCKNHKETLCMLWVNPVIFTDCRETPWWLTDFPTICKYYRVSPQQGKPAKTPYCPVKFWSVDFFFQNQDDPIIKEILYYGVSPQSVNITGFVHNIHRVFLWFLQPFSIDSAGFPCRDPVIPSPCSFHGVKICSAILPLR